MDRRSALAILASGLAMPAIAAEKRPISQSIGFTPDRTRIDAALK